MYIIINKWILLVVFKELKLKLYKLDVKIRGIEEIVDVVVVNFDK